MGGRIRRHRAAHLDGILDRQLGGQHVGRAADAPQAGVGATVTACRKATWSLPRSASRARRHATYVISIKDPVYLTEPLVRSRNFVA
jgi:hypothetical protein